MGTARTSCASWQHYHKLRSRLLSRGPSTVRFARPVSYFTSSLVHGEWSHDATPGDCVLNVQRIDSVAHLDRRYRHWLTDRTRIALDIIQSEGWNVFNSYVFVDCPKLITYYVFQNRHASTNFVLEFISCLTKLSWSSCSSISTC